jgi:hypothetical protein
MASTEMTRRFREVWFTGAGESEPVKITVASGGQTPVPRPFLMILIWIRTPGG